MPYQDKAGRLWTSSSPQIRRRAKALRQRMTEAERSFWEAVRNRRLAGAKFRRQCPLGPFIVDFYCAELKLIVEIDGDIHHDSIQRANDVERDAECGAHGYTVLRFTNQQVNQELNHLLLELTRIIWALRHQKSNLTNSEQ